MFTARHDERVWKPRILTVLPNAPAGSKASVLRARVYDDLEVIRRLRNRLAHHGPVFTRDLPADLARIMELIELTVALRDRSPCRPRPSHTRGSDT